MRSGFLIAISTFAPILFWSGALAESDNWFVAQGERSYVFVNASTIQKMGDGTRWVWVEIVDEGPLVAKEGFKYIKNYQGFSCAYNTSSTANLVEYSRDGEVVKDLSGDPTPYSRIVPDSLGEAEKNFVCEEPTTWASDSRWLHLDQGRDPIVVADAFYRLEHPTPSRRK